MRDRIECSILWERLDEPGHDACRLLRCADGWVLDGVAVTAAGAQPAALRYRIECGSDWCLRFGTIGGWTAAGRIELAIERGPDGAWRCNGIAVAGLDDCVDLDLGFTPATNLSQLQRLALPVGGAADLPVAWLDVTGSQRPPRVQPLIQHYVRRNETAYRYEAPAFGYAQTLAVGPEGFVRDYPGLWRAVTVTGG